MPAIIIYGPKGSGKTYNAEAFARHYGKTNIQDTDGFPVPNRVPSDTLVLTTDRPAWDDPRTWIRIDDALEAIGKLRTW